MPALRVALDSQEIRNPLRSSGGMGSWVPNCRNTKVHEGPTLMDEQTAPVGAVGHQLALQRRLVGLTQQQLAARSHVSTSLISQVERGVVPASPAFTAAVARGLGVDVQALYGQPYGPPITDPQAERAGILALRAALDGVEDPELPDHPMTPAELRVRLDECNRDRARARFAEMTTKLPDLLQHAYMIVADARAGAEAETSWSLLSDAYMLAQNATFRLGHLDLATHFNERWRHAAGRSGDPLRPATAASQRVQLRLNRCDYQGVQRIMERAHTEIANQHNPAADAVRAQLHLRQAIAYARSGTADRADEHITAAHELIARGVPATPYYDVIATTTNVNLHWVSVPVELTDGTTAVGRAGQVQTPECDEPQRAGRHWIDVARAWTLHGDRIQALDSLNRARRIAPQLTRYPPQVHETVYLLAETDRRAPTPWPGSPAGSASHSELPFGLTSQRPVGLAG
jgi:transcriptional regulator with XRE-family HTH domain